MSSDYLKVVYLDGVPEEKGCDAYKYRVRPFAVSEIFFASIASARKLTEGEDVKVVYKLGFNLTDVGHEFLPGDTIGLLPCNDERLIEQLFIRLNVESVAEKICELQILEETSKKNPIIPKHLPPKSTLRSIFLKNVDIQTPPKKLFLKSLARFAEDPDERAKLEAVSSPKSSKEYTELITTSGKTLLGLLNTFPSCTPPVEVLLEHLPPLQPRPYSISSSPLSHKLEITFFVLIHEDGRKGLCTGWLENLIQHKKKEAVPFYFRATTPFRLPQDLAVPLVLIATGTGVAPFRGFLQHRMLREDLYGDIWVLYGCRYRDKDFLYQDEIVEYTQSGLVNRLNAAFSRDGEEKKYVQNYIGTDVIDWILERGARVFVCGDLKTVVRDVKRAIVEGFVKHAKMSGAEAESYMLQMETGGKFIVDTWT